MQYSFFIFITIVLLISCSECSAIQSYAMQDTSRINTIIKKPRKLTPLQTITGDSVTRDTIPQQESLIPGSINSFTAEQDSAYYRMLRLGIAPGTLAQLHAKIISLGIARQREQEQENPFAIALRNLDLPPEYYQPQPQELVQREEMIARSQAIPTGRPGGPRGGISIGLNEIATYLGLAEDVSPVITYTVEFAMPIKVVVYSTAAREVALMFQGEQTAGTYRLTWNGRDDKGRPMPSGDYVAEVRLGNDRFIRKRITIP
ncbi:MAG: FlgD immunoglobulin-like domain containing protein [bacterium]